MAIGLDVSMPLRRNDTFGFYALSETIKDNVKQNVKMLILTAPGERIMFPTYGVGLKNYLFENDPEFTIVERIREQVSLFLPNIAIVTLEVRKGTDREIAHAGHKHLLTVNFIYLIKGINLKDSLELVQKQVT